jgi:hypothetical protein
MFSTSAPAGLTWLVGSGIASPLAAVPRVFYTKARVETLKLSKSSSTAITVTLHFLKWNIGGGVTPAIAAQSYSWLAASTELYITPFPGFFKVELTVVSDPGTPFTIGYSESVPTPEQDVTTWTPIDFGAILATGGGRPIDAFGRDFVQYGATFANSFQILRNSSGLYRSSVEWPTDEMVFYDKLTPGSPSPGPPATFTRVCSYLGKEYPVCFVLPSHPFATDSSNDGNNPLKPRQTILVGGSYCYILEAGYMFLRQDMKDSSGTIHPTISSDCIFMSSEPGVPSVISNFEAVSTNLASIFGTVDGSKDSECTNTFATLSGPNLLMFEPYYERTNGSGTTVTDRTPLPVPFSTQNPVSSSRGRMWRDGSALKIRTFNKDTDSTADSTYASEANVKPAIGFVQDATANILVSGGNTSSPVTFVGMKDIELWGGNSVLKASSTNVPTLRLLMVDSHCRFGSTSIGLSGVNSSLALIQGNVFAYFIRSMIEWSCSDGIDGDYAGDYFACILEDRVIARFMGENPLFATAKNQCSTYHGRARGCRVGGAMSRVYGSVVADVGVAGTAAPGSYGLEFGCYFALARYGNSESNALSYAKILSDTSFPDDTTFGWLLQPKFTDRYGRLAMPANRYVRVVSLSTLVVDQVFTVSTTSATQNIYLRDAGSKLERRIN